jgi:hypothetical protein
VKRLILGLLCLVLVLAVVGPAVAVPVECQYARWAPWAALACALQLAADVWIYGDGPSHQPGDGDGVSGGG